MSYKEEALLKAQKNNEPPQKEEKQVQKELTPIQVLKKELEEKSSDLQSVIDKIQGANSANL